MITTHETSEKFFIVYENDVVVPGIYETAEIAAKAPSMKDEEISYLLGPIYNFDGLDRPVNADDMFLALHAVEELRLNKFNGSFVEHNGE